MYTFTYKCKNCNKYVETTVTDRDENVFCPKCNRLMERQFPSPVSHFKGSGFYETDYKNKT